MARGKRTELIAALAVKAMAELGYWPSLIGEALGVASATVTDIIQARGPWQELSCNAQFEPLKTRFKQAMEEGEVALAIQALARLESKLSNASFWECLSVFQVVTGQRR